MTRDFPGGVTVMSGGHPLEASGWVENIYEYEAIIGVIWAIISGAMVAYVLWNRVWPRGPSAPNGESRREVSDTRNQAGTLTVVLTLNESLIQKENENSTLTIIPSAVGAFKDMVSLAKLFAIATVQSDEEERIVKDLLQENGCFDAGLPRHRLVFSSTVKGRGSMARQLAPRFFIDPDTTVLKSLIGLIPKLMLITGTRPSSQHQASPTGTGQLATYGNLQSAFSALKASLMS